MFYKFLDTKDVDRVLVDGTILLGSLSYYRELDTDQTPWIGDPLEGASKLTTPENFSITEGSPEHTLINRSNIGLATFKEFVHIEGGGTISMGGVKIIHQAPDLHVFCFSCGSLEDLTHTMCKTSARPYDACLRIHDPRALLQGIVDHGITQLDYRPLYQILGKARWAPVTYEQVSRSVLEGPAILPSPTKKDRRFSAQKEHRFIFEPLEQEKLPNQIVVRIPEPRRYFSEVFRNGSCF